MIFLVTAETLFSVEHLAPQLLLHQVEAGQSKALAVTDEDNMPMSLLLFETQGETCTLLWLHTHPTARRQGYASQLLEALHEVAQGFDLVCTLSTLHPLMDFLGQKGFFPMAMDEITYETTVAQLALHPFWKGEKDSPSVKTLASVEHRAVEIFTHHVVKQGNPARMALPLQPENYTLAFGYLEGDGTLSGVVLVEEQPSGTLQVSALHVLEGKSAVAVALLKKVGHVILGQYSKDTTLYVTTVNHSAKQLAQRLLYGAVVHSTTHMISYATEGGESLS